MKKSIKLIILCFSFIISSETQAQSILPCSRINIISLSPDSTSPTGYILYFQANGNALGTTEAWFHATNIYDCNGNLISSSSASWFGVVADTTTTQQLYVDSIHINNCSYYTIEFIIRDPFTDTCIYTFTNTVLSLKDKSHDKITLYPNPTSSKILLNTNESYIGSGYLLFDILGKPILNGNIHSTTEEIDLEKLSSGVYYLKFGWNGNEMIKVIKEVTY